MPLDYKPKTPWPPKKWAAIQDDVEKAAAWYADDADLLQLFYNKATPASNTIGNRITSAVRGRKKSGAAAPRDTTRHAVSVPIAGDIAATSADLLFGAEPSFVIPEAMNSKEAAAVAAANGETAGASGPGSGATAAQDRLEEMLSDEGITSTLLEAAEIASALGGVYLRAGWDTAASDAPVLSVVQPDYAVPDFRYGHLVAVTLWEVIRNENGRVVRHLERHEPGVIYHGLYSGSRDALGVKIALTAEDATAGLADEIPTPWASGLLVRYIPNALPNRRHRSLPAGRPDTAGAETLMTALNETFTSWLRDIRLGQARIIVPSEFVDRAGRGAGADFDVDREVFVPLEMDPAAREKAGISPVEFKLRTAEHGETALALITRIVQAARYSPQTFGLQLDGQAESGTALRLREQTTYRTTGKKQRYFKAPVEAILRALLEIESNIFARTVEPFRPRLQYGEDKTESPRATAETVDLLKRAQAASIETRIRMVNPEWGEDEVAAEAARIRAEEGLEVMNPDGLPV